MSLVGLALIVKDEEENLPHLLASISGAFDRVVLLDTGSTDSTIDVFADWVKDQHSLNDDFSSEIATFEWVDDFSAARNAADDLLMRVPVEWRSWADADDVIVGAHNIRTLLANAPAEVTALFAHYDYFQDPATGSCVCALRRERFVRTSSGMRWEGRVHEATGIDQGVIQHIPDSILHWKHQKDMEATAEQSNKRNISILEQWYEDEPTNTRVVAYLGTEYSSCGRNAEAITFFRKYIHLGSDWTEELAQVHRKLAKCLVEEGEFNYAKSIGLQALGNLPSWTDSYLTLAETSLALGDNDAAIYWAKQALALGCPQGTLLILNPLEYEFMPRKVMAFAFANLGQWDKALAAGNDALQVARDKTLMQAVQQWQAGRQREGTAKLVVDLATLLINHDEQAKALLILEQAVPHFVVDHPAVVQVRSNLRERISWINDVDDFSDHYEFGGSKPEDFIKDEQIDELCELLPRTKFLYDNLSEYITDNINKELKA